MRFLLQVSFSSTVRHLNYFYFNFIPLRKLYKVRAKYRDLDFANVVLEPKIEFLIR